MRHLLRILTGLWFLLGIASGALAVDIVKAGRPVAVIVAEGKFDAAPAPAKGKGKAGRKVPVFGEQRAAVMLAEWVKKITDAELPIVEKAQPGQAAIYVGRAAIKAGLKLNDIPSPSKEGLRIVVEGNRVLIAGQCDAATNKGVARFLEELGCRYFMDTPLGEVFPRTKDLSAPNTTITEKPALMYRNPKGPSWNSEAWKTWNGAGGEPFAHSHSWSSYLPAGTYEKHPEYFAMGADGQRKNGAWVCTSNPELRRFFAEQVIAKVKAGNRHPSISPTDGGGYCQCPVCKAQDDPKIIEPSSGTVAVSNRYADFFDDIGRRVAKECPEAILSFYVYANYTQVPSFKDRKLSPNLVAVIAPIRYCRLHALGDPNCPSRHQQLELVEGWAKLASRLGYYNYMYNLADATLPMFKYTPCKVEFPYLASKGLTYMTIEVLSNWYLYGPQIYLSLRMAYDPALDAAKVMEDYYTKFYGPAAAPMKAYWLGIDDATAKLHSHSGGFYGLEGIYTPEFLRACQSRLKQAAEATMGQSAYGERVAMHASGFQNVLDYKAIEEAMLRGDYVQAKKVYDHMTTRIGGLATKHQANGEYGTAYLRRFLLKAIEGGLAATAAPNKMVKPLADRWKVLLDSSSDAEKKYTDPGFDDSRWKSAATYSETLSHQGIDSNGVLWYRTKFMVPESHGPLALFFPEVDGKPVSVYVNGKLMPAESVLKAASKGAGKPKKGKGKAAPTLPATTPNADAAAAPVARRAPFEVKLDGILQPGENTVVVKADNHIISELYLGGILRPVLLIELGAKP